MKKRKWKAVGFILMISAAIAVASSYYGFKEAEASCVKSGGTVVEKDVSLLAFHWKLSCEQG